MKAKNKLLKLLALAMASEEERSRIIDLELPLSKCTIWPMLERVYLDADMDIWKTIPFYITSNMYISDTYAEIIVHFLLDYSSRLDPAEPINIVELGSGCGYLAFNLLKQLSRKLELLPKLKQLQWRYIMTDLTSKTVAAWLDNERLAKYHEAGILDFAVFIPEHEHSLKTKRYGIKVGPDNCRNPTIFIANYFFDALRQDAFQVVGHQLVEVLHSFSYSEESGITKENAGSPNFDAMEKQESYADVKSPRYKSPDIESVLQSYVSDFEDATIIFPVGAFTCLQNLSKMTNDNFVLICTDKGFSGPNDVKGLWETEFHRDPGIFSYPVNFDATARYFRLNGGFAMHSDVGFTVETQVGFKLPNTDLNDLSLTAYYIEENLIRKNAVNHLFYAQNILQNQSEEFSAQDLLRGCIGFITLSNCDPKAFSRCTEIILECLAEANDLLKSQLRVLIEEVEGNYYKIETTFDVMYDIALVRLRLGLYDEALSGFLSSIEVQKPKAASTYYAGYCCEALGRKEYALKWYYRSLEVDNSSQFSESANQAIRRLKSRSE